MSRQRKITFAVRLRGLRREHRLTLQELADTVGCTKSHMWDMEKGRAKNPGLAILAPLADRFKITIDYLVGRPFIHAPLPKTPYPTHTAGTIQ